jgi:hypothetical protein
MMAPPQTRRCEVLVVGAGPAVRESLPRLAWHPVAGDSEPDVRSR